MQDTSLRRLLDMASDSPEPIEQAISDYVPTTPLPPNELAKTDPTEALLNTRQTTHGEFGDNARVSQSIKRTLRAEPGWDLLTDTERECMDMIALKISRLLSGKALELQHWEDIVGYAKLAEKLCKSQS